MITGCTLDRLCVVGESESEDEGTNKGMFFLKMARYHFFKSDTDIINFADTDMNPISCVF